MIAETKADPQPTHRKINPKPTVKVASAKMSGPSGLVLLAISSKAVATYSMGHSVQASQYMADDTVRQSEECGVFKGSGHLFKGSQCVSKSVQSTGWMPLSAKSSAGFSHGKKKEQNNPAY
jgi:hypothetical protein